VPVARPDLTTPATPKTPAPKTAWPETAEPETAGPKTAGLKTVGVYWPGHGWAATQLYRGAPDSPVTGPALVELPHTTVAVPHGASLSTGSHGELLLKLKES
jgi:N-methylhydantoinase A